MTRRELSARLTKVLIEMDEIVREIGPKWIKLGHLRKEVSEIEEGIRKLGPEADEG